MLQLGGQTGAVEPQIDRQRCRFERLPFLHFSWRAPLIALVVGIVLCCHSEAFAHIAYHSPYRDGVSETAWAAVSNSIFFFGQLLGWAYLTAVLQAERRGPVWRNLGLAFLIQAGVAFVLLFASVVSFYMAAGFMRESHIAASAYEILGVVRPKLVRYLLLASTATFAIGWLSSDLLLLIVRGMHRRWLVALFHVLVFHPFAFPVGILVGLMYVLRVWQLVPENFLKNNPAKITAICGGLAICSLVLLLAKCVGLDSFVPGTIIFDDVFFGQRWPLVVTGYYLADALFMGSVVLLLPRRPMSATVIGLVWTTFVLAETLNDLPVFADDPHMLVEELSFVLIYVVLLGHLVCHYYRTRRRHNA